MTLFPQPGPTPSRPPAWPTFVAWLVIAACVLLIMAAGLRPRETEPAALEKATTGPGNVDLLIQSRAAVGLHHLGGDKSGPSPAAAVVASLDEAARRSPTTRLRLVPVVAEVNGVNAALARLDELAGENLPEADTEDLDALRTIYTCGVDALDPAEGDQLLARHGWSARLALTHCSPPDHPERAAVIGSAKRVAMVLIALSFVGLAAAALGLVLLVIALVRYFNGQVRFAHVPPAPGRDGPFVEAFAVYLVGTVLVSLVIAAVFRARSDGDIPLAANLLLALAVPPAIAWLRLRGLTPDEIRAGLGWHRGRGFVREALAGVVGYLAGLPILAVAVLVTSVLIRVSGTTPTHPIVEHAAGGTTPAVVLQLYLLAAVYAPVVEELMFRGALYHHVRRRMPWWLAGVVVALIFAAIHPQGWVGIPMLATIAVMLAVLREWRGSIVAPAVAHACVNGVTVTMLVLLAG